MAYLLRYKEVKIYVRAVKRYVYCRPHTADFVTLRTIFVKKEYQVDFPTPPKYIIDCGANVGYSTLAFAIFYPSAQVIALEPEEQNYKLLMRNIKGLSNITPLQKAIWSHHTYLALANSSALSHSFQYQEENKVNVPALTEAVSISDLIAIYNLDRIDLLKIDIEGAEKELFSGEDLSWLKQVKRIAVELHGADIKAVVFEVMNRYGFIRKKVGEKHVFINKATLA